jgi:dimeric dUTPase (all-alpha-NTP-PPase superfamily)
MENKFDLSSLSDAELNEFYVGIAKEIAERHKQKSQNAWDKLVSAIKEYLEIEDGISIQCEGEESYLDKYADFSDIGAIIIS